MSGAASLSSAKRRRSGGANLPPSTHNKVNDTPYNNTRSTTQRNYNEDENEHKQTNNIVRLANTSNIAGAISIHDQILVETIKQINSHTQQITSVNETLKKVGNNENSIHERLSKVEELLNKLLEKDSQRTTPENTSENISTTSTNITSKNSEDVDAIKNEVKSEISETLNQSSSSDKESSPTQGAYRTKKRGKKNNVSMTIDDA